MRRVVGARMPAPTTAVALALLVMAGAGARATPPGDATPNKVPPVASTPRAGAPVKGLPTTLESSSTDANERRYSNAEPATRSH